MNKDRCLGLTYGLLAGAVVGILFAPRSGVRTRALIAAKAREGQLVLKEKTAEIRSGVVDRIERTTDAAKRISHGLVRAAAVGRKTAMR